MLIYIYNGSTIWSPFYQNHIDSLEAVQRRFLRFLSYRYDIKYKLTNYDLRLKHFNFTSLYNRRQILDLCVLHKIIHGKLDTNILPNIHFNCPRRTPRNIKPFFIPGHRTNSTVNTPVHRMCQLYNSLISSHNHIDIFGSPLPGFRYAIKLLYNNE